MDPDPPSRTRIEPVGAPSMSTRIRYLNFSDIDSYAKASYKHVYELLPSKVDMEWSRCPSFISPDQDAMAWGYIRFNIGHLVVSESDSDSDKQVYAYVTVYPGGNPRICYTPEGGSDSVIAQTGKVVWYTPFDKLDTSSKSAVTRASRFRVVLLYYMLASGRVPPVQIDEAEFHATLKTVCWKLYGKEQVHQEPDALEGSKRSREDDNVPSPARAVKGPSIMESRAFSGGLNQETKSDQLLGSGYSTDRVQYTPSPSLLVQTGDNLEVKNANLQSQIEDLEMKLAEELEATRNSIRLRENAAKADQEMIKKLQISNNEADQLIEKLDEKIHHLRTERNGLKDRKQILAGDKAALEDEKKSLEARIESLQEEKEDLETRVSDLLVGRDTLRKQINALGNEVLLTKEKAGAYSQKVKDLSLEF